LGVVAVNLLGIDQPSSPQRSAGRLTTGVLAILVTIGSLASLAVREGSPGSAAPPVPKRTRLKPIEARITPPPRPAEARDPVDSADSAPKLVADEDVPDLASPPSAPPRNLAILEPDGRTVGSPPLPPQDLRSRLALPEVTPPPPMPDSSTISIAPPPRVGDEGPRRVLVRDKQRGRAIVAREYEMVKDRMAVLLPDGQIGWPDGPILTQKPFVPSSMEEMAASILDDPEFATFRVHPTAHYLIVYRCSENFAKASGKLLERLHDGLTAALKKNGLPVASMEFPLVAVIFSTEDDFRANRRVSPDVQAYYDRFSNRIFFYEKSRRDQDAPEVSALRKPQTVAHEGTHQILHNVGIQPRLSDWPLWLVEGLAEYCSSPKVTKNGVDWAGLGQANPIHLATIRDLDDPHPDQFKNGPNAELLKRDRSKPLVEYLVTRKDLTPTDYALSWALTHYLATQRIEDFVAYIKRMSHLKPFEEQAPEEQLATFREIFGKDLAQMDGKVAKHLKKFQQGDVLPYYAVIFEQPIGPMIRRQAMVSQSPSVIRQWLESVVAPEGGEHHYRILPQLSQKKALETVEQWMMQGR
jgi:Protein of unknown function (DUF1570)